MHKELPCHFTGNGSSIIFFSVMQHSKDEAGRDIKKAAEILRCGGTVIYPTETVYGIGASIFSKEALKKVFDIKKRNARKPVSIAVSSFDMIDELVHMGEKERAFIEKFLPGPVTILLKKKPAVPDILTPDTDIVGIRYPDHRLALELIERAGVPITSTSANISGEAPPRNVDEIKISADYIIDGGTCNGEPSTVIDLVNLRLVRKGARYEEVMAALRKMKEGL